jgi:hypothetical protein
MKHKNNKTKNNFKYKPKHGGASLPIATPVPVVIPISSGEGGVTKVSIKKAGLFSAETLASLPGKLMTIVNFIAVLSFMLGLYIIYMLFTAFFSLINAIIDSINKAVSGLLRKLPFGIGKKIRYKQIPNVSKNLFDLLLNKVQPIPPIF